MKSYTDLEQSKKLAEILPIESADMYYLYDEHMEMYDDYPRLITDIDEFWDNDVPCWSLAALLNVLPKGTNISTPKPTNELSYCCWNQYDEIYADNPVDACYEMVLKLKEKNLL